MATVTESRQIMDHHSYFEGAEANKKKSRPAMFPIFEYFLVSWIDAAETARMPITDEVIRAQGKKIADRLGVIDECKENYDNFEMSSGWLQGFKQRHNIDQHKRHRQSGGTFDQAAIPTHRLSLSTGLRQFAARDRYNCDESRLHSDKHPEINTPGGPGDEGDNGDRSKFTIFFCVNADGTDRRRVTVISKVRTPSVFRREHVNPANLPVTYRYNKKISLPTDLWYEFLRSFDSDMRASRRHIALVCENCPTYPPPTKPPSSYKGPPPPVLTNITLFFLPTNTAPVLQPLSQGIIASFKATYRKMYTELLLEHLGNTGSRREKLNTLEAIDIIASAWSAIPARIILQCWQTAAICEDLQTIDVGGSPADYIEGQKCQCQSFCQRLQPRHELSQTVFEEFWRSDEEIPGSGDSEPEVPDVARIVDEGVASGILRSGPEAIDSLDPELDADDAEEDLQGDPASASQIISHKLAIQYLAEVNRYLRSLPVSELKTPLGKEISVTGAIESNALVMAGIPQ